MFHLTLPCNSKKEKSIVYAFIIQPECCTNGLEKVPSSPKHHFVFPSTVCAQLYHAGTDAQLDADGKRQPVLAAAHGQLYHAVLCEANIHSNPLHERGNDHQVSVDYQWNTTDQDIVRYLCQCQHQRHRQGTCARHCCGSFTNSAGLF